MMGANKLGFVLLTVITAYHPFISNRLRNKSDVEDFKQSVFLMLWKYFTNNPKAWGRISKKIPYVKLVIRRELFAFLKMKAKEPKSYDAEENLFLIDNYSDQGECIRQLNEDLDMQKFRKEIESLMERYSPEDQELIELNLLQGMFPREIAQMLGKDPKEVSINCSIARAKVLRLLKKEILSR